MDKILPEDLVRRYAIDRAKACCEKSEELDEEVRRSIELLLLGLPDMTYTFKKPVKTWIALDRGETTIISVQVSKISMGCEIYIITDTGEQHLIWYVIPPCRLTLLNYLLKDIYGLEE